MKAGFGKEQIFIKKKLELTGFKRGRISNKTLDGIFCRAILLEDKKNLKFFFWVSIYYLLAEAYQIK